MYITYISDEKLFTLYTYLEDEPMIWYVTQKVVFD